MDPKVGTSAVVEVMCDACGGTGVEGYASREMAMDGGDPSLEGMAIPCGNCNGDGRTLVECDPTTAPENEEPTEHP